MNRKTLTKRQQQFFDWMLDYFTEYGKSPTMRELGDHFDMKPPSAFDVVNALIKKGFVRKVGNGPYRTLDLIDESGHSIEPNKLPLIGEVAAGTPVLAVENWLGSLVIDDRLLQRGAAFALKIRGDSMIEAGILNGDFVIIKMQPSANDGDIVLAIVDGEATVKYLHRQKEGQIVLRPANQTMSDIIVPADDCLIQGVVIALQREF